ncbi:MAG: hypothetical protein ICV83_07070 [Cytophagales bacterium]|nr:hypothetical protein [Cytophagales bacterium]
MKFLESKRAVARCARRTPAAKWGHALLAALLLAAPATLDARNPEPRPVSAPGRPAPALASPSPSPRMDLIVYQVYNTPALRVQFAHGADTPVTLRLENEQGQLLYREVVARPLYVRKFDLSELPDARYYVVLQARGQRMVKQVQVSTRATRNLIVQ